MPELPEVETLCRQLKDVVSGEKISSVKVLDPRLGTLKGLKGRKILSPYRRGKGLAIPLDNGRTLLLHLRMTGRLLWQKGKPELHPHTRLAIGLTGGSLHLIDPRRFATLTVQQGTPSAEEGILKKSSARFLFEQGRGRSLPVKSFLMDQRFISGIGNIYACEILHRACIDPKRKTGGLSLADWETIAHIAPSILKKAVACRGTTVSDWRDLYGRPGEYQNYLAVYGRKGLPCPQCGAAVERFKLGGRGTYFCPLCQK